MLAYHQDPVDTCMLLTTSDHQCSAAAGVGPGVFIPTHRSVVLAAKDKSSPQSQEALETLCRTYWYPHYVFARRQGRKPHDAQDLTQEFFIRLLQKNYLDAVERDRGRFRIFLIMAFKRFLANEWDRSRAQKRGGGQTPLPLDPELTESRYQEEASVKMAVHRLRRRYRAVFREAISQTVATAAAVDEEMQHRLEVLSR